MEVVSQAKREKKKKKNIQQQQQPQNKTSISLLVNFQSPLQDSSCYGRTRRRWWERRLQEWKFPD